MMTQATAALRVRAGQGMSVEPRNRMETMNQTSTTSQSQFVQSLQELGHDLATPSRLLPALSSGFVVGLLLIVIELSLASLIFSGPLSSLAPAASGLTLFGTFVMCIVLALGSGFPSTICVPEDASSAIMASVAAGLASGLSANALDPRATL